VNENQRTQGKKQKKKDGEEARKDEQKQGSSI